MRCPERLFSSGILLSTIFSGKNRLQPSDHAEGLTIPDHAADGKYSADPAI
jgi:hypothetical protein